MENNWYYMPGHHRLCYCHEIRRGDLILGALSVFFNDAKTNIFRQKITVENFESYRPMLVDKDLLDNYSFLEKEKLFSVVCYRVRETIPSHVSGQSLDKSHSVLWLSSFVEAPEKILFKNFNE